VQGDVLSVIAASALIRSRWLSVRARTPGEAIAASRLPGFVASAPAQLISSCTAVPR
jgi:hypothetical protein